MLKLLFLFPCLLFANPAPEWMTKQISQDLEPHQNKAISTSELTRFFHGEGDHFNVAKFTIHENRVSSEASIQFDYFYPRLEAIKASLARITGEKVVPDMTFVVIIGDCFLTPMEWEGECSLPIFVQCKLKEDIYNILIPDSDALAATYQVVRPLNLTTFYFPWEKKVPLLVWRGTKTQHPMAKEYVTMQEDNLRLFSRITLSKLSQEYPSLIDAGLTRITPNDLPQVRELSKGFLSYDSMARYKYQINIDGSVSSFHNSGWRYFSNSLVFVPDSPWIQWYFQDLEPYVHYVPVNEDLSDLIEKIEWAKAHDLEAKQIAATAHQFAREHIAQDRCDEYLYHALIAYSKLNFVD